MGESVGVTPFSHRHGEWCYKGCLFVYEENRDRLASATDVETLVDLQLALGKKISNCICWSCGDGI